MTYNITEVYSNLLVDFLHPYNITGSNTFSFKIPQTFNTNITCTEDTDYFTLYSGFSYYIEGTVLGHNAGTKGDFTWQFYNETSSQLIGHEAYANQHESFAGVNRVGRSVCSCLILDNEIIGNSIDIKIMKTSETGTDWSFDSTLHTKKSIVKIFQIKP